MNLQSTTETDQSDSEHGLLFSQSGRWCILGLPLIRH